MYCLVQGKVMNVRKGYNGEAPTVELYQKGQSNLIRIRDVPPEIAFNFDEMEEATFYCDVFPWISKNGNVSLIVKFVGEENNGI